MALELFRRPFVTCARSIAGATALVALLSVGSAEAASFGPCAIATTAPQSVVAALDEVLARAVDPDSPIAGILGYAPGAVLSIKGPDWRYIRSIGVADPDTAVALDCESPFQIGSNTKMMTATVLLQLVEEGALQLDDPLSKYLPEIAAALPYGKAVTLRQLAQHRSGVFSYTDNAPDGTPGIIEGDFAEPDAMRKGYRPEDLVGFALAHGKPQFAPGSDGAWSYSNTGFVLLGLVIEKLEQKPIGDVYQTRIFAPLGMKDTFLWDGVPRAEFGLPRSFQRAPFEIEATSWNMSQGWAAGGVISTANDMHVFMSTLLSGGLFHNSETLAIMQDGLPTGIPSLSFYGIGLAEKEPGLWGHGGQTPGYASDVAGFQDSGISVVAWATSSENVMELGAASAAEALQKTGVIKDPADAATAALIEDLTSTAWQMVGIEADGHTTQIQSPNQYQIRFHPDGSVTIKADCNRAIGDWGLDKLAMTITIGPTTRALCPDDSKSELFLQLLGQAVSASVVDNDMSIFTNNIKGLTVLNFQPTD